MIQSLYLVTFGLFGLITGLAIQFKYKYNLNWYEAYLEAVDWLMRQMK